jgi:GNAT superfamily N-acetyltransferase
MSPLSRDRALELQQRGLRDCVLLLGSSSPGASTARRGGITAAIVPACPERSLCNSVTYADTAELIGALDDLDAMYREAGIAAWTVWTPEFDEEAIAAMEAAGHMLDGEPLAMSISLADFEPPELGDLDWDTEAEPSDLGRLNDVAYGLPIGSGLGPGLAEVGQEATIYRAKVDGETACVLGTMDHDGGDLGFYFVATHPDRRGLGLASRLMSVALADAAARGLRTSSLQASAMGRPIYRKLGYDDDFTLRMYERRR